MRRHEKTTRSVSRGCSPHSGRGASLPIADPLSGAESSFSSALGNVERTLASRSTRAPPDPRRGACREFPTEPGGAGRLAPLHHGDGRGREALLPLRLLLLRELVRGAVPAPRALPGRGAASPGLRPGEWPPVALRRDGRGGVVGETFVPQVLCLALVLGSDSQNDLISGCLAFFTLKGDNSVSCETVVRNECMHA